MVRRFDARSPEFEAEFDAFLAEPRAVASPEIAAAAGRIVDDVRTRGPEALIAATWQFDRLALDPVTLQAETVNLESLARLCPPKVRAAVDFAAQRIEAYHAIQRPSDHRFTDAIGADLGWRWSAIEAVGLYVPGGRASYPSSVLMNAIPARVAGVERLVMVAPAPDGVLNPAVAYAAIRSGVVEYYPIGGAQAVAALAYGAGPIRPVDKIVGPGNAYVAEAKRRVFGTVGIDTIAGPSEICVLADGLNDPAWIAADLLSQSEHDPSSQSILITDDAAFADRVTEAAEGHLKTLASADTARTSWTRHGAIIIVERLVDGVAISNKIAPEHLEIATESDEALAAMVRHAGAIFLGRHAPEALGDYVTGSNHVLPTSRAARFSSGLSVLDFMKRTSIQRIGPDAFAALAPAAMDLAEAEGLPAHRLSVSLRSNSRS
jgi:histidinol dehydrogenase